MVILNCTSNCNIENVRVLRKTVKFPCLIVVHAMPSLASIYDVQHRQSPGQSHHQLSLSSLTSATREHVLVSLQPVAVGTFSSVCMLVHMLSSLLYKAVWCRLAQCSDTVKGCLYENKFHVKSVKNFICCHSRLCRTTNLFTYFIT